MIHVRGCDTAGEIVSQFRQEFKSTAPKKGTFDSYVVYWRLVDLQGGANDTKGAGSDRVSSTNKQRHEKQTIEEKIEYK